MKMYIPEIGDQFILTNNWDFDIYSEYRNESLLKKIGINFSWSDRVTKKYPTTIVKGVTLKVDRIYIRKGNSEYSSLTFYIVSGEYKGCRFWAKLSDVNKIEFDEVKVTQNIKVSFSESLTTSVKDRIFRWDGRDYSWEYNSLKEKITCKVNSKDIIKINTIIDERNLTPEEIKLLNETKTYNKYPCNLGFFGSPLAKYSEKDKKVLKYELEAVVKSTGEVIGKTGTTTTLSKKIKEFIQKNPQLIS